VKDHVNTCESCAIAVNDLRVFRNQVASEINVEYQPSPVHITPRRGWHRFLTNLPSLWPQSSAQVFGWAFAALCLTVCIWLIWQVLQRREPKQEITVTPSPTVTPLGLPVPAPDEGAAMVIAQLNDGEGQVRLDREGKLSGIENLPPAYQQVVRE